MRKNPKSVTLIEKDFLLTKNLKKKYFKKRRITIFNADILKFDLKKLKKKKLIVIGNLPYNISSQILIKIVKQKKIYTLFNDIIFMFQKELGEKILCKFPSKNYGRLSIITKLNLIIKVIFCITKLFLSKT